MASSTAGETGGENRREQQSNVRYTRVAIGNLDKLPEFDIKNGEASTAASLIVRASVPESYHWVPIRDLPAQLATKFVDAFILCHQARLEAHRPVGWNDQQVRRAAIFLGTARAVVTAYYRLTDTDFIPGELAAPYLTYTPPTEANLATDPRALGTLGFTAEATNAARAIISTPLNLSAVETAVISSLVGTCVGIPALQGFSLIGCGHHYLSDQKSQSHKAFAAVEKQFWRATDVSEYYQAEIDMARDMLWHKSCHPISMTLKGEWATSEKVKTMLIGAAAGSAAARLPALEPEVRAASSYQALFATVKPMFEMYQGGIDARLLDVALDAVKKFPPGREDVFELNPRDERIPPSVVNRRTAKEWVGEIVARANAVAGQCYGFYCAMYDNTVGMSGEARVDTLKTAYSLNKLKTTSIASYNIGYQQYGDYQAARNKQRQRGVYEAPIFTIN